jgi:hypothetical protein
LFDDGGQLESAVGERILDMEDTLGEIFFSYEFILHESPQPLVEYLGGYTWYVAFQFSRAAYAFVDGGYHGSGPLAAHHVFQAAVGPTFFQ